MDAVPLGVAHDQLVRRRRAARGRAPAPGAARLPVRVAHLHGGAEPGHRRRRAARGRTLGRRPGRRCPATTAKPSSTRPASTSARPSTARRPGTQPKPSSMLGEEVAGLLEALDGAAACDRSTAGPSRRARASSRGAQRSPPLAVVVEDRLGHRLGLGGWPCWKRVQARRPMAQPRPPWSPSSSKVAAGRAQPRLGLLGPARSRTRTTPGSAGPRPRRAGRRAPRTAAERLLEQLGGLVVLVAEQRAEARAGAAPRPRPARRRAARTRSPASARAASDGVPGATPSARCRPARAGRRPRSPRPSAPAWRHSSTAACGVGPGRRELAQPGQGPGPAGEEGAVPGPVRGRRAGAGPRRRGARPPRGARPASARAAARSTQCSARSCRSSGRPVDAAPSSAASSAART